MRRVLLVGAVLGLCAACGGSGGGGGGGGGATGYAAVLQGTWRTCFDNGAYDAGVEYAISGMGGTYAEYTFTSADGTCSAGAAVDTATIDPFSFSLGAAVSAGFGAGTVTAHEINLTMSDGTPAFDIVYVNTAVSPHRLYSGFASGSSAATRPTALNDLNPFIKR
jgi:hypothetical protein